MNEPLFVDTSAWYALVNRRDPEHAAVRTALESSRGRLVTSNFVFDEVITLCLHRLGHDIAVKVGEQLRRGKTIDLVRVSAQDEGSAWDLFRDRADKHYSFTDCVSFVLMRRLNLTRAAALDDDFAREGFVVVP